MTTITIEVCPLVLQAANYSWEKHNHLLEQIDNGELHKTDGPAFEGADGRCLWVIGDKLYDNFDSWLDANDELSDSEKTLLKLEHG